MHSNLIKAFEKRLLNFVPSYMTERFPGSAQNFLDKYRRNSQVASASYQKETVQIQETIRPIGRSYSNSE